MTKTNILGVILRRLERRLLQSCALLIVSSEKFIDAYFARFHESLPRWILLENKLLRSELGTDMIAQIDDAGCSDAPPWRIGWFGIIRCSRSLQLLAALVRSSNGTIEVEIRGRPAIDVLPDFYAVVAATPGMTFGGAYDRATDLPTIYGRVHFNWAIDFYEDGLNSAWLLPNRLYEGSMFGCVPLALAQVETGRWLTRHGCGLLLDGVLEQTLSALFVAMTPSMYREARERIISLEPGALMETPETASAFVATLAQLPSTARVVEPRLIPVRTI
ncbi:hypothetical protein HN018_00620 [Lichenicola cladoniae]|uniref:Uncharacterized protein n=1 Tax=Lichenicola cladoniae TaxID=1484109 RepID=A0A6M8HGF4_9PROT|nr:hypothetical protein [Lichenicola cladoniae]NPD65147.1 hypothetical protein [Acetobacteraceae bacterium]QKE88752.1 hypothetical protein HN018_00620 [Lichenicola cladoniae]